MLRRVYFIFNGDNIPNIPNHTDYKVYARQNAVALVEFGLKEVLGMVCTDMQDGDELEAFFQMLTTVTCEEYQVLKEEMPEVEEIIRFNTKHVIVRYKSIILEILDL